MIITGEAMPLLFEPVRIDKQSTYLTRFSECMQKASDYSFINIWGWATAHGLKWAWQDDLVWIKQTRPETKYWAPVGAWERIDWATRMDRLFSEPVKFVRVPDALRQIWNSALGDRIAVEESRGDWDYLYSANDLIGLKGNRFHKKKNLVNQFMKKYRSSYTPLGRETIQQAVDMQTDWCAWRDCETYDTLAAENGAIENVLNSWNLLHGIIGGALLVDGEMVAYTVAEKLTIDTALIHFEKANPDYKGSYQAINRGFLEHTGADLSRVNREQDLNDEGLRKAKLSYHPVDFVRKCSVTVR